MDKRILINDSKKYSSILRNFDSIEKRMSLYQKTANFIRLYLNDNGINFDYNGTPLCISVNMCDDVQVIADKHLGINSGAYDMESSLSIIHMRADIKATNIYESCKTIAHETGHYAQTCICNIQSDTQDAVSKFLDTLNSNLNISKSYQLFGISINDRIYINGNERVDSVQFNMVIDALYNLSLIERMSNSFQYTYAKEILNQNDQYIIQLQKQNIQTLRNRYNIQPGVDDNEILQLLDNASVNLHQQLEPSNYIEAQMMYDITLTIGLQTNQISKIDYEKRMNINCVSKCLAELALKTNNPNYFSPAITSHNLQQMSFFDIEIEKLDVGDLLNNPEIILYSLLEDAEKTKNLIPSIEMLQDWCYSTQNYFPKEFMDEIANVLGPEFSGKRCAEEQQKNKDAIKKQEIDKRIATNQDNEIKFETHIETQEINGPEIGNNQ